ncbi:hypothetical protein AX760_24660 [Pararhizobium antarcticum]|uniref:Glutamate-1-semialdehyde 2,1-aminomutase n=2 Tax=Pararhizobium antarcticum TaxID=1798805 RepID=A0A657LM46_9HYPH|nr:hypothetical protein AX760_24660 [Pararhizobium antarcticum]
MAWMAGLFRHPTLFVTGGKGSRFIDADGISLIDFNLADLSNTVGYGDNPVAQAVARQAARGAQFLLPTEDALVVAEALADRTSMPFWQFTISASTANMEAIRIARTITGRQKIVLFDGKYHGHIDPTMAEGGAPGSSIAAVPEAMGLSPHEAANAVNIPFNDLTALEAALAEGDVALVLVEPALSNCSLVLPKPEFLQALCRMTRATGALAALDETHTWAMEYGGFTRMLALKPDFITLGKGLGSGIPLGAYGMTPEIAEFVQRHRDVDIAPTRGLAIGGTTFANALAMAAARAMLTEVATIDAYQRIATLGQRMADGIDAMIAARGLPWRAFRHGPRSGFCLTPELPLTYAEAKPSVNPELSDARRVFMANRGIWDAIATAGPQVSFAHSTDDVDLYLQVAASFLDNLER